MPNMASQTHLFHKGCGITTTVNMFLVGRTPLKPKWGGYNMSKVQTYYAEYVCTAPGLFVCLYSCV